MISRLFSRSGGRSTATERLGLPPLETVDRVDLARYAGTWFEIASFPTRFQRGACATNATYTLRNDGGVTVVNRCRRGSLDGAESSIAGRARAVDSTNAKIEVSFFWPLRGDYWIIDLDPDYAWSVVGHPSRDYLWILSRTRTLPEQTYAAIVARAGRKGYEVERLRLTPQPAESAREAP
jgi:apolipoprotein D and lipocalin family protein